MLKRLMKNKIKEEVKNTAVKSGKRGMMYAGVILAGAGVYFSYKMMKNCKGEDYKEENSYLEGSEYDVYDHKDYDEIPFENESKNENIEENKSEPKDKKVDELEKKVAEFNSRRISCENCTNPSAEEMRHFLANMDKDKKNMNIYHDGYTEGYREEYDNHEEGTSKKD